MDRNTNDAVKSHLRARGYRLGQPLGAGTFCEVSRCMQVGTGREYAVKVIMKRFIAGREDIVSHVPPRPASFSLPSATAVI